MKKNLLILCKWFLCWLVTFIVQKLYFILLTYKDDIGITGVFNSILHGLKLDVASIGYVMILPVLIYLTVPECKFKNIAMKAYYILAAILVSAIIVVDAALYPFWQFKLDTTIFLYLDKPGDAMASVSVWFIIWHVIQFVIWVFVIWKMADVMGIFAKDRETDRIWPIRWKTVAGRFIALIITATALTIAIRGGIDQGTNNVSAAYYCNDQYLNHCAVNPVFNMIFSIGDEEDFGSCYQFYDEKNRAEYMKGIYHTDSENTDSLLKTNRPDILLIVWEGCCQYMFEKPEVTPYLNRTAAENINFTHCIANSFRTDRGLTCIMSGYLGLVSQSLMKLPEKSDFMPAFPQKLRDAGYETTFWYGGDITFTNMSGYMYQAGFQRHVCNNDFTRKEQSASWGVPDGILFDRLLKEMESKHDGKPQFNAVMTLSSHEPWDVPTSRLQDEMENSFNYSDECIGKLLERLKKTPLWNNLLVIITADHGLTGEPLPLYDEHIIHIPMVWTGGAIKGNKAIDQTMNQSDLAATLLAQLGLKHNEFQFSRDVLSSSYTYHTAINTNKEGITFIDSTGTTVYSTDTRKSIEGYDPLRENKAKATLQTLYKAVGVLGNKKTE